MTLVRAVQQAGKHVCTPPNCSQVCEEARQAIASALPPELVGSASVMAEGD